MSSQDGILPVASCSISKTSAGRLGTLRAKAARIFGFLSVSSVAQ